MRCVLRLLSVLLVIPAVGCGTLANQSPEYSMFNPKGFRPHRVYGGVRVAGGMVLDPDPGRVSPPVSESERCLFALFWAIQLPLSAIADTVLLPFDTWAQFMRLTRRVAEDTPDAGPAKSPPLVEGAGKKSVERVSQGG